MKRRKRSVLPVAIVSVCLLLAVGFALFGKSTPTEENTGAGPAEEPAPAAETPAQPPEQQPPVEISETDRLFQEFENLYRSGDMRGALSAIRKLFTSDVSDRERAVLAEKSIEINRRLILMEADEREVVIHKVRSGEVLTTIARKYKSLHGQWGILRLVNNLTDPNRLRAGRKLRVPKGTWSLFIDKSMFRMWLMIEVTPFKEYAVAHGRDGKTPATTFTVRSKTPKPDWYPPASTGLRGKIPYGHPKNPLGEYWIALRHDAYDGFGIHGTNDDSVIGTAVSNGCIRMHNKDVLEMANIVFKGMEVAIVE